MGHLQVLPGNIANMIAAGEVVQRPSSVVKELMENAVDAGATEVKVLVTDSGRTLIQVIDNGCGMSEEDALLCFERHATSKIASAEDLNDIVTYGFRGEALASIAAVSDVTLRTRREEDETATQVELSGTETGSVLSHAVAHKGSNFAVRNHFYNVPARRKFLKSDNVELKHIIDEFTRVALTRPDVGFSLTHNGRDIYMLKQAKSLKFRILDLLGTNVVGDVVDLESRTTVASITGFLGRPDAAKKTQGNQFFFVNGRYFRSAYLHKAVMKAYEELIPSGLNPSYFIYLEVDPHSVDVNIHPTKTEVKFEEDVVLFQTIYACVKEVLGKNAFGASIDFDAAGEVQMPISSGRFNDFVPGAGSPEPVLDPDYNPFDLSPVAADWGKDMPEEEAPLYREPHYTPSREKPQDYAKLFEESVVPTRQLLILHDKFLLSQVKSGLMVIHIRRALERILYERFVEAFRQNGHISQSSLFPVRVQIGAGNVLVFEEHKEMLNKLGFSVQPFGDDCVVVESVPEGYSCEPGKAEQLVNDLLSILNEDYSSLEEVMISSLAAKLAALGAAGANKISTNYEAQKLIDSLFACTNAEFTIGGKKIVEIISSDEIDNKF